MGSSNSKSGSFESSPARLAGKKWDYIIVGGGTAGCVLANRLSEDPNVSVLVLEAGASHTDVTLSKIPLAFSKLFKTSYDWDFQTVPQAGLDNRTVYWPRGKILGGSSSINAVMYHRCSPSDFDEWGQLTGSKEWSYESLLPYFNKSEGFDPSSNPKIDVSHRGTEGPWKTSWGPYNQICEDAVKACENVGIPSTNDFNTPAGSLGTARFPGFVDPKGHRSSAATAYLTPEVAARPNLTIAVQCHATKLLFSSPSSEAGDKKITGVEIGSSISSKKSVATAPTERFTVTANREVILTAGAVATPQLLLLSGVGPKAELESHKIKVELENENVGANLLDHVLSIVSFRAQPNTTLGYLDSPVGGLVALGKWLATGGGIYSAIAPQAAAFVRSDDKSLPFNAPHSAELVIQDPTSGSRAPDIELVWMAAPFLDYGLTAPPKGVEIFTMGFTLLRPQSKGTIKLKSTDPYEKPLIDPKYLDSENDLNIMTKALRLILVVANSDPLKKKLKLQIGATDASPSNIWWPADADPAKVTDDELKTYLRRSCGTLYHPVGTARMGTSSSNSVVTPNLLVHGISNLRIVDASIFPSQISGHPTAAIIAIAEKAADIIKGAKA